MSKDGKFQMWDLSSYMRKLLFSLLAPVFTGSSFRLFASIAAQSRAGSCKYSGSNQLSWPFDSKSCQRVQMVQLAQCGVWGADPGSGVHFCQLKQVMYCAVWPIQCHRWDDLVCQSMMIYPQLTGSRRSSPCSCVWESEWLAVLCVSVAAPRENTCWVRCHFQTVLLHSEPYCIMWRMQGGLVPLPEFFWKFLSPQCWAVNKSYLSKWLGLSLLEGSDQMGRSQTVSKLDEGRWDKTGQSTDRPEAEWVNKWVLKSHVKVKPCCRNSLLQVASGSTCSSKYLSLKCHFVFLVCYLHGLCIKLVQATLSHMLVHPSSVRCKSKQCCYGSS